MKFFIIPFLLITSLSSGCAIANQKVAVKKTPPVRWNIVAIVPDDHSRRAMGAYGDPQAVTPNFDRLASEGVRFTNAYAAAPVCSPSRASFFSGKYPSQVGVSDFLLLTPYYEGRGMDVSATLWPQILKANGYATGLVGKWHLGAGTGAFHPKNRGFDYFVGYEQSASPFNPTLDVNGVIQEVQGHTSNIFASAAKDFLQQNKDRPFALTVTFREPQVPWHEVPEEDLAAVAHIDPLVPTSAAMDTKWLKKITRDKYAAIHALDRGVGEILDELDRLGLADNTIVLYVGDHGMLIGHHGLYGRGAVGVVSGNKVIAEEAIANLYDEAIKIPFLIRWPGKIAMNSVIVVPVSNIDVFPTILKMLNISTPDDVAPEGKDITALLKGDIPKTPEPVFAQYDMENFGIAHLRMVRFENWKLVKRFGQGAPGAWVDELYDVAADPKEEKNLIGDAQYQPVIKKLEAMLTTWQHKIKDPVLAEYKHLDVYAKK